MATATATRITVDIDGLNIPADGAEHNGWRVFYRAPFMTVARVGWDYTVTGKITTSFQCGRRQEETSPGEWEATTKRLVMDAAKDNRPKVYKGEAFWVLNAEEDQRTYTWDESRRLQMRQRILPFLDRPLLRKLRRILDLFGDSGQARDTAQGRDWGHMRRYSYRLLRGDDAPFRGLLESQVPQNGNGFSPINEYNSTFWLWLKFVLDGRPADWINLLEMMLSRTHWGTVWEAGENYGLQRYPGGSDSIGVGHDVVVYKQWAVDLVWMNWLFPHPVFEDALYHFYVSFEGRFGTTVWGEAWGARNAKHQLQNLRLFGEWYVSRAQAHFHNALDLADDATGWINAGNGGQAEVSPWQQSELVAELATCSRSLFNFSRWDEIISVAERVVETGTTYEGGKFRTLYRSHPPASRRLGHEASLTGLMMATLRVLHEDNPARWRTRWNDAVSALEDFEARGEGLLDSNTAGDKDAAMVLHSVVRW